MQAQTQPPPKSSKQDPCITLEQLHKRKQQKRKQLSAYSIIPIAVVFLNNYASNAFVPNVFILVAVLKQILKIRAKKSCTIKGHIQAHCLCIYSTKDPWKEMRIPILHIGNPGYKIPYLQKKKMKICSQGFSLTRLEISNLNSNTIDIQQF